MPVAENTEPLELLGLDIEPVGGEIAALLAKLLDRNLVLVLALLAVLLLDLPFDGKAVTVPARDIVGILAEHRLRPVDHILENLVQRMSDMKLAVGVGRAVMKHEQLGIGARLAEPVIDIDLLPALEDFRLLLREPSTHREVGSRQEHCLFVIHNKLSRFSCLAVRTPVRCGAAPALPVRPSVEWVAGFRGRRGHPWRSGTSARRYR